MTQEEIDFILEVFPNVAKILPCATEKNLEQLFARAQEKVDFELTEAQFE